MHDRSTATRPEPPEQPRLIPADGVVRRAERALELRPHRYACFDGVPDNPFTAPPRSQTADDLDPTRPALRLPRRHDRTRIRPEADHLPVPRV
jgi:hypothetical protein